MRRDRHDVGRAVGEQTPVPANATFIMCLAKSHAGWRIFWCAAVMLQLAV